MNPERLVFPLGPAVTYKFERFVRTSGVCAVDLQHWLNEALANHEKWTAEYGAFTPHSSLQTDPALFGSALAELQDRLRDNYPFFHPRYAGQMLKPPHPAAVVGYLSAMLINPNNHALDGGPATATMEREVVARLARCSATATSTWAT